MLQQSLTALEIIPSLNRPHVELKDPVVFRTDDEHFTVRHIKNIRGNVMCELEMPDDKIMRPYQQLPVGAQQMIDAKLNALPSIVNSINPLSNEKSSLPPVA